MGITLFYRGRIDDLRRVACLSDELVDIADAMGWKSYRLDEDWDRDPAARFVRGNDSVTIDGHLGLKGVGISPGQGCEPLDLFFDREGVLRSPVSVALACNATGAADNGWISTKTQFAPIDVHAWIVGLLGYLKRHYISNLEVQDDARYWETGDMEVLRESRRVMAGLFDRVESALSSADFGVSANETADSIADRIERLLMRLPGPERKDEAPGQGSLH